MYFFKNILGEAKAQWSLKRNDELRACGKVEYVSLENGGGALYLATQNKFKFPKFEQHSNEVSDNQGNK